MMNKPRVVLDTNVLLVSLSSRSKYHWLFKALLENKYELYITNEILSEYEEITANKWSSEVSKYLIRTLLESENVFKTDIYFRLNLINNDPDDNKFVDCAFASNADMIVSHDQDFDILKELDFPKIKVVKISDFERLIRN